MDLPFLPPFKPLITGLFPVSGDIGLRYDGEPRSKSLHLLAHVCLCMLSKLLIYR